MFRTRIVHTSGTFFEMFRVFEHFPKFRKYFGILGVFVKEIVICNIGFGFCVLNSILEHRLKISFDPPNRKLDPTKNQKNPRSVNSFRTKHLGGYFGIFVRRFTRDLVQHARLIYTYIYIYTQNTYS